MKLNIPYAIKLNRYSTQQGHDEMVARFTRCDVWGSFDRQSMVVISQVVGGLNETDTHAILETLFELTDNGIQAMWSMAEDLVLTVTTI